MRSRDDELDRVARLREAARTPLRLAVIAAYEPLHALPDAEALLEKAWPAPVDALLTQQVREPRAEAAERAKIPRLTPIDDDVSRAVQAMYEENPYPRWIAAGGPTPYASVDALMQREFPRAPFRHIGKSDLDVLVAGCGTGRHSIEVARQFPRAAVTAIDLSSASLAYAATRARALGLTNVTHMQADILRLGSIGRSFDMIQAAGVLHHLARPVGRLARAALAAASRRRDVRRALQRACAARRGGGARFHRAAWLRVDRRRDPRLPAGVDDARRKYAAAERRAVQRLLHHQRMPRPPVPRPGAPHDTAGRSNAFLDANGLTFLGFSLDPRTAQRYAARFPDDPAMVDLDRWDAFEQDNPYTFASMYRFWVQKAG